MSKTIDKAKRVLQALINNESIEQIKKKEAKDDDDWGRISKKAYDLNLKNESKHRQIEERTIGISCTPVNEINELLELNKSLLNYALCIPTIVTKADVKKIRFLITGMPNNEHEIISFLSNIIMDPRIRALQKKGRFEVLFPFKEFSLIIESATISYYRENYIASYLTLIPVIEGVISRWIGFSGQGEKPEFKQLKIFFRASYTRQPKPGNPLFYDIFYQACDRLLTNHFYKPSTEGDAYSNFNRHLAAHFLNDSTFATKENCIRLFLLLDTMTEVYIYEKYVTDERFSLEQNDIEKELTLYCLILKEGKLPERILLNRYY